MNELTAQRLRELLHYDPETGLFTRLVVTCNKVKIGDVAGTLQGSGHIGIRVLGKIRQAHRLAWLYMTGEWPTGEVDHIDGVPTNNRWANLRDVTRPINMQNRRRAYANNKSGFLGVDYRPNLGKWAAQIGVNGAKIYLGLFDSPESAHDAYVSAKRKYHEGNTL